MEGHLPTVGGGQYWQEGWFPDATLDAQKATLMTTLRVDGHYVLPSACRSLQVATSTSRNFPYRLHCHHPQI